MGKCLTRMSGRRPTRGLVLGAAVAACVFAYVGCAGQPPANTETDPPAESDRLQGQVPLADQENGRSLQPYMGNMRLVGQQDVENRGENGNLGWIGDCAYVAAYFGGKDRLAGMAVVDASNPSNPELVKIFTGTPGTRESQVEAHEGRGMVIVMPFSHPATPYGAPPGPSQLQIYDASKDCRDPIRVATYDFNGGEVPGEIVTHEHRISEDGNTVWATVGSPETPGDALMAIDMSDMANPTLIASWDLSHEPGMPESGMHDLEVNADGTRAYGNYNYLVDNEVQQGLVVLDTSEVAERRTDAQIRRISSFNWGPPENFGYTHSSHLVKIAGRDYVIAMDETMGDRGGPDNHGVGAPWGWARIIDINDEEYPLQISTIKLEVCEEQYAEQTDPDGAIYGSHYLGVDDPFDTSLVFFTWYSSGLRVWDVRDPYQPKEVGYYIPGARPDTVLPVSDSYPNNLVDYTYSYVRYRPETGHVWFNSLFNGFQIVELIDNPLRQSISE